MSDDINCKKCIHCDMCSAYKAVKLFKEQFDKEYKNDIKVVFPDNIENLAENCQSFVSIERGKSWR
jgi:PHP family Zn ribbon phosphoesterase|tara:strand:- start:1942 stop:2139 length:198 start_codon:yes stop_codon:yes gene_type:complete